MSVDPHCTHQNDSKSTSATLSARMFMCARCHANTMVCSCCDRGNVYCPLCRTIARKEARRQTAKRYQQSYIGRSKHAERQRRYRERQRHLEAKVTHQGRTASKIVIKPNDRQKVVNQQAEMPYKVQLNAIICDYCKEICTPYVRRNFSSRTC